MRTMIFGLGAAGNKAVILAVENHVISQDNAILINSTTTDIPSSYEGLKIELPGKIGGTGKDRNISKKQAKHALENNLIDIKGFLFDENDRKKYDQVILVSSTDGGSGSGSTTVFADYIKNKLNVPVFIYAFVGRPKDIRGPRNTVEFFKEIGNKYTVSIIANEKFAAGADDTNDSLIESKANVEFCKSLGLILGNSISHEDVEQNLDDRELVKIRTTPGYFISAVKVFDDKIKNVEQVRKEAMELFDKLPYPDPDDKDMTRVGLIYNSANDESSYMDILPVVKEKFGLSFETFTHRQYKDEKECPRMFGVLMAGLPMPSKYVADIYAEYAEATKTINKSGDDFGKTVNDMTFSDDDDVFETESMDDILGF